MADASRLLSWPEIEHIARGLPRKANLVVPKGIVAEAPPYRASRLGRPRGCLRQYRDRQRRETVHLKEYVDRWVIHVDTWNPHRHPLRHLLVDHGYKIFIDLLHVLDRSGSPESATPVADVAPPEAAA